MEVKPLKRIKFDGNGATGDVYEVTDDPARADAKASVKTINGIAPDQLGNVALLTPRGEYDPDARYNKLDTVQYEGSLYLVKEQCMGVTPEDGSYYMLAAQRGADGNVSFDELTDDQKESLKGEKGEKGDTGETGAQGLQGETGPQGAAGRGVSSMTYDSGTNIWTVTYTEGSAETVDGPAIPALSSSVSSASTATAATSSAVKQAYDKAAAAMPKSGGTFTGAAYAVSGAGTEAQLRNTGLYTAETDPTVNGQINWNYE